MDGLLRSLLYQLLSEHPQFVQYVDSSIKEWTLKRLRTTLHTLVKHSRDENVKICLLLDGLDEFEGQGEANDQAPLVDLVRGLIGTENLKAIVSSRPEPLFFDRLSPYPHLRLQDLNQGDISKFVRGRLLQEPSTERYLVSNLILVCHLKICCF